MKKILVLLLLCVGFVDARAIVNISGVISANTTWTVANSPYIVNGNLTIDSGVTLTIEPGVHVLIDSGYYFRIDGRLLAEGTNVDTILFTSHRATPSNMAWQGLEFTVKSVTDTSKLRYCRLQYARMAVYSQSALIAMNNTVFANNMIGVKVHIASYIYSKNFISINKCLITQNDTGVCNTGNANINSDILQNELSFNGVGMNEQNTFMGFRRFNYNEFNYNKVGYSATGGQYGSRLNNFKGNSQYGVRIIQAAPGIVGYVSEGLFLYNATAIYMDNANGGNVYNNTFAYNTIGIDDYFSSTGFTGTRNRFASYNCYKSNTLYNFRENSNKDVPIGNDYFWGASTTASIDSTIYDFYDNTAKGKVPYTPVNTLSNCKASSPPPPCLQPDSVNAVALSGASATASWNRISGAPAYEYYVVPIAAAAPAQGALTADTFVNISNLAAGETYRVCVRTRCASAPFYTGWVCDTFTTPCIAPRLHINRVAMFNATVSWDSIEGVSAYEYTVQVHPSVPAIGGTITGNTSVYIVGLNPGVVYDVCVRSRCANGTSVWVCDTMKTLTTGIEHGPDALQPRIYPNPNNGVFNIDVPANAPAGMATVLDVNGRILQSKKYTAGTTLQFDMKDAVKGVYVVRFTAGTTTSHATMVVN